MRFVRNDEKIKMSEWALALKPSTMNPCVQYILNSPSLISQGSPFHSKSRRVLKVCCTEHEPFDLTFNHRIARD